MDYTGIYETPRPVSVVRNYVTNFIVIASEASLLTNSMCPLSVYLSAYIHVYVVSAYVSFDASEAPRYAEM